MSPFGFGRKGQPQPFTTDIKDKEDLEEIKEIAEMLNPNEKLLVLIISKIRHSQYLKSIIMKIFHFM